MFTGIVQDIGSVVSLSKIGNAAKIAIRTQMDLSAVHIGDSIACNGVCLTIESMEGAILHFHAMEETLSRSNLGLSHGGSPINLEPALRMGDPLGGHLVRGHIDCTAPIIAIGRKGDDRVLDIALPPALRELVIMKGSIAINGVSLTVAALERGSFGVCIIPHTWTHTNLHELKPGDNVNLETDILGKYVLRQHELENETKNSSGVSMEMIVN
jgi:riboflavin synthase